MTVAAPDSASETTTGIYGKTATAGSANTATANTTTNISNSNVNDNLPSAVEFEPPVACVRRILKKTLPSSSNVGKDAVAAFARASGIFIIYLTTCANDFARENRRQTITANDVLAAIKELEFDEFSPELNMFLESYREAERNKKDAKAKAAAARAKEATTKSTDADHEDDDAATATVTTTPIVAPVSIVDSGLSAIENKSNISKDDVTTNAENEVDKDIDANANSNDDGDIDEDEDVSMDQEK